VTRGEEEESKGTLLEEIRAHLHEGFPIEQGEGAIAWRRIFHGGGGLHLREGALRTWRRIGAFLEERRTHLHERFV
jgi:hypothetical protein